MVPSPRHGWGLPHGGQLGHAFPSALSTGSTSRLTAQFFAFWPTAPSLAGTHCQSATSPVGLRRGLDFNQLEAGITPRHPPLLFKEGKGHYVYALIAKAWICFSGTPVSRAMRAQSSYSGATLTTLPSSFETLIFTFPYSVSTLTNSRASVVRSTVCRRMPMVVVS